jgi:hypothetical protein
MAEAITQPLDWIMRLSVGAIALVLAAPLPAQAQERGRAEAISSDLRVFFDDRCLPEWERSAALRDRESDPTKRFGGFPAFGVELAIGLGATIIKSFGAALADMGAPHLDRSSGLSGGMFFFKPAQTVGGAGGLRATMNPGIRCVHVVRDGFLRPAGAKDADPFAKAPSDYKALWGAIGLHNIPSFYAQFRLDASPDKEAFRAKLLHVSVDRFERAGKTTRDYLLVLEFAAPAKTRRPIAESIESGIAYAESSIGGPFAHGGVQLSDMGRGAYRRHDDLRGKETGWMSLPGTNEMTTLGAFNLRAELVEMKAGDPFLVELGNLLRSDPVVGAAKQDIQNAVKPGR